MYTTTLRRVGGSVMLAVPPGLLDVLGLRTGARLGIRIDKDRLVVEPKKRPRYTMDELLAQCDPRAPRTREEREWVTGQAAGKELI